MILCLWYSAFNRRVASRGFELGAWHGQSWVCEVACLQWPTGGVCAGTAQEYVRAHSQVNVQPCRCLRREHN